MALVLPPARGDMSYRDVRTAQAAGMEAYYSASLRYGHYLWQQGHAGRAILALTRALYADLPEAALVLREWPLPYAAIYWIVHNHSSNDFPGNPRVSFQHQATRIRGARKELLQARAWAVWYLIRDARPSLPADTKQGIEEPGFESIQAGLCRFGHTNEVDIWLKALDR